MLQKFRTYQLARELYLRCTELDLKGEAKDQLHRATMSIVLNLAEGSGRRTAADRRRFYGMALGSLREAQALIDLVGNEENALLADKLGASLWCLNQNPGRLPESET